MIKRSKLKEFKLQRYNKATSCMKLKENDNLISAILEDEETVFLSTRDGYGLSFATSEIPITGIKSAGVKGINVKDDILVSVNNFNRSNAEFLTVITERATAKRIRLSEFEISTRARKGLLIIREVKTNPYKVLKTFITDNKSYLGLKTSILNEFKLTELPITDRYSTWKELLKQNIFDAYIKTELKTKNDSEIIEELDIPKKEKINLDDIDSRLMTIDDFLN